MDYVQLETEDAAAPLVRVTIPTLRSVADRGPFLPDFEELLGFAATQIPQKDGILPSWGRAFPPRFGRTPRVPVLLFDQSTDTYSSTELMLEARRRGIR